LGLGFSGAAESRTALTTNTPPSAAAEAVVVGPSSLKSRNPNPEILPRNLDVGFTSEQKSELVLLQWILAVLPTLLGDCEL
jgi:hypothetical protein